MVEASGVVGVVETEREQIVCVFNWLMGECVVICANSICDEEELGQRRERTIGWIEHL